MAYYSLKDCFLYCSGYDLSAQMTGLGAKMTSEFVKWRGLGSTAPTTTLLGTRDVEITCAGLYESTTTALTVAPGNTTNRVFVAGFETDDESKKFWGIPDALLSEAELNLAPDDLDRVTPVLVANGKGYEGYIVAPLAARTTAGNTQATYADMGASASAPKAFLIVTALDLDGYDSLTVTVQSCATSGGSYDDETAFTAVTTTGGQTVTLAGTVNRYLAIKWAYAGTGTDPSWTGWVGVAPEW